MLFFLISISLPALVFLFLPQIIRILTGKRPISRKYLIFPCLLFFVSYYIPSPQIQGENTAFVTHFVGGGIFCGFIWLYILKQIEFRPHWFQSLIMLYFLVNGLGVANELMELFLSQVSDLPLTPSDTWWDLLANNLGALTFWIGYQVLKK